MQGFNINIDLQPLTVIYIYICLGSASGFMRTLQRLVCGMWIPSSNEFIKPSL